MWNRMSRNTGDVLKGEKEFIIISSKRLLLRDILYVFAPQTFLSRWIVTPFVIE